MGSFMRLCEARISHLSLPPPLFQLNNKRTREDSSLNSCSNVGAFSMQQNEIFQQTAASTSCILGPFREQKWNDLRAGKRSIRSSRKRQFFPSEVAPAVTHKHLFFRCNVSHTPAASTDEGISGLWSVIIPTYNRLPILKKCLKALEEQSDGLVEAGVKEYEIVVVDDGSTDGTVEFLSENKAAFPHLKLFKQQHGGATAARNYGMSASKGSTIVFIDSDMVVAKDFLKSHALALRAAYAMDGNDKAFSYGRVVNTANFDDPQSEKFKITDYSAAFFATGNVAISRKRLLAAALLLSGNSTSPFDADFSEYGWEDLELGERLRQQGARIVHCPDAVGYHFHPAFSLNQLPHLIEQERQRGRNGVRFFRKHPNLNVRLMIQMTPFHELLWALLTLNGLLNEKTMEPLLRALVNRGQWRLALGLLSPVLNWHTVQALKEELRKV